MVSMWNITPIPYPLNPAVLYCTWLTLFAPFGSMATLQNIIKLTRDHSIGVFLKRFHWVSLHRSHINRVTRNSLRYNQFSVCRADWVPEWWETACLSSIVPMAYQAKPWRCTMNPYNPRSMNLTFWTSAVHNKKSIPECTAECRFEMIRKFNDEFIIFCLTVVVNSCWNKLSGNKPGTKPYQHLICGLFWSIVIFCCHHVVPYNQSSTTELFRHKCVVRDSFDIYLFIYFIKIKWQH